MQIQLEQFLDHLRRQLDQGLPRCEERYSIFAEEDPYPDIPPALLHAGHLASYVIATGMIEPFYPEKLTKPATYPVSIVGSCRYRDGSGRKQAFYLSNDKDAQTTEQIRDTFELKPNSVCYVSLEPYFRIPAYIAGRFNLLIRDVYRSLLVGTGPLVDPGFCGQLSIPIHNFTTNSYEIRAGEDFVYFEFTKLSWRFGEARRSRPPWCPSPIDDQPPFPADKQRRRTLDHYLDLATGGGPAQNAIGMHIKRMEEETEEIKKTYTKLRNILIGVGVALGSLGFLVIFALAFESWSLISAAQEFVESVRAERASSLAGLDEKANSAGRQIEQQATASQELRGAVDDLRVQTESQLEEFRAALEALRNARMEGASDPDQGAGAE